MSCRFRRFSAGVVIGGTGMLLAGMACAALGLRVNTSKSIPLGLYWISDAPIETGRYVLFCPPQAAVFETARDRGYMSAGFCPGGHGYLMKKVLASHPDLMSVTDEGVHVNQVLLPQSTPWAADSAGRPLPYYRVNNYRLGALDVLLMSDVSATSFDGRYYGPIPVGQIRASLAPVVTF